MRPTFWECAFPTFLGLDCTCRTTIQKALEEAVSSPSLKSWMKRTGAWSEWITQPCLITTSLCVSYVTSCNLTPILYVSATELNRLKCRHFFIFMVCLQLFYISSFTPAQKFDTAVTNDEYPVLYFLSLWWNRHLWQQFFKRVSMTVLERLLISEDFHLLSIILASGWITVCFCGCAWPNSVGKKSFAWQCAGSVCCWQNVAF